MIKKLFLIFLVLLLASTAFSQSYPKFSAHKNGVTQTPIPTNTFVKITFPTAEYNIGDTYDAPNSRWVPGIIGVVHIDATIHWGVGKLGTPFEIMIDLNGVHYRDSNVIGVGTWGVHSQINIDIPITAIDDYIEIYAWHNAGDDRYIYGTILDTYFMGHMLP